MFFGMREGIGGVVVRWSVLLCYSVLVFAVLYWLHTALLYSTGSSYVYRLSAVRDGSKPSQR